MRGKNTWFGRRRKMQRIRRDKKRRKNEEHEKKGISFTIWNVAGAHSLDEDTWIEIKKYEVIGLVETWIKERNEKLIKERLRGYKWYFNEARREKKIGRAKGGLVGAVKKCEEMKEVKFI